MLFLTAHADSALGRGRRGEREEGRGGSAAVHAAERATIAVCNTLLHLLCDFVYALRLQRAANRNLIKPSGKGNGQRERAGNGKREGNSGTVGASGQGEGVVADWRSLGRGSSTSRSSVLWLSR